jgi:hypothetical protein
VPLHGVAVPCGLPPLTLVGEAGFPDAAAILPAIPADGETAALSSLLQPTSHTMADTNKTIAKAMNNFFMAFLLWWNGGLVN